MLPILTNRVAQSLDGLRFTDESTRERWPRPLPLSRLCSVWRPTSLVAFDRSDRDRPGAPAREALADLVCVFSRVRAGWERSAVVSPS